MSKITPIHYKKLVKVFEKEGFIFARQRGSHLYYIKAGIKRPIVIPIYKQVPVFIILNNLRAAGVSREKYFELLKD